MSNTEPDPTDPEEPHVDPGVDLRHRYVWQPGDVKMKPDGWKPRHPLKEEP